MIRSLYTLLRQTAGEAAAEGEHQAAEAGAAAEDAGGVDLGETIMHHLVDSPHWELPFLPDLGVQIPPIHVAGLTIDVSITKHVMLMMLAAVITAVTFIAIARVVQRKYRDDAPSGFANAMEAMILYFRDEVVRRNIGHGADRFTPYILTLFFFILTMNLLGLVPWGGSATGNISVTAALAVISLIVIEVSGFMELGPKGYAKTIFYAPEGMNPVGKALMLVIMTPVEFLGKLTKPFALAIRLFANMTAGHTLIFALGGLIFIFVGATAAAVGVGSTLMALFIMCLELFVAFLQAYIFAMLTAVFIGLIQHAH